MKLESRLAMTFIFYNVLSHGLSHFIYNNTLERYYYHYTMDEKAEVQKSWTDCSGLQGQWVVESGSEPRFFKSQKPFFSLSLTLYSSETALYIVTL